MVPVLYLTSLYLIYFMAQFVTLNPLLLSSHFPTFLRTGSTNLFSVFLFLVEYINFFILYSLRIS